MNFSLGPNFFALEKKSHEDQKKWKLETETIPPLKSDFSWELEDPLKISDNVPHNLNLSNEGFKFVNIENILKDSVKINIEKEEDEKYELVEIEDIMKKVIETITDPKLLPCHLGEEDCYCKRHCKGETVPILSSFQSKSKKLKKKVIEIVELEDFSDDEDENGCEPWEEKFKKFPKYDWRKVYCTFKQIIKGKKIDNEEKFILLQWKIPDVINYVRYLKSKNKINVPRLR